MPYNGKLIFNSLVFINIYYWVVKLGLREEFEFIEVQLPKWDIENTKELMEKFGCENVQINSQDVSVLLYEKSEGSPLYLTYILMTLSGYEDITESHVESLNVSFGPNELILGAQVFTAVFTAMSSGIIFFKELRDLLKKSKATNQIIVITEGRTISITPQTDNSTFCQLQIEIDDV